VLFLDEPTSGEPAMTGEVTNFHFHSEENIYFNLFSPGLDSRGALVVIRAMRRIADSGRVRSPIQLCAQRC